MTNKIKVTLRMQRNQRPLDPYLEKLWAWIKRNWRAEHPEAGLRRTLLVGANDAAKYWRPQMKKK